MNSIATTPPAIPSTPATRSPVQKGGFGARFTTSTASTVIGINEIAVDFNAEYLSLDTITELLLRGALVETAQATDESLYYEKRFLISILEDLVDALIPFQSEEGMFYQVPDKPEAEGNYLETSGTALIAYAILKGVRLGFLAPRYAAIGEKAFDGIVKKYLSKNEDGTLKLSGICLVAGLGGKDHRDGSLKYYFSEPVVENEAKGVAPFLLAYTEMIRREENEDAI